MWYGGVIPLGQMTHKTKFELDVPNPQPVSTVLPKVAAWFEIVTSWLELDVRVVIPARVEANWN